MDEKMEIEPDKPLFSSIVVDMIVDDTSIILNNNDNNDDAREAVPKSHKNPMDYKEEILRSGLVDSDAEYFTRAYKSLEEVKFIKIHCTGCDKHMGSAPNELNNRYQHPILKVLLCQKCFHFYLSGEFEKGEDGSELYCRWCGEGGLVYCCTKCPFVFCKNCITRNLGRGTARIIENTENWVCFACNPWQISRHRATYWAIQKYSEDMIAKSKITGDVDSLNDDLNICCQGKKRLEPCEKSRSSVAKKPKILKVPFETNSTLLQTALQGTIPSTSKGKKSSNHLIMWQPVSPVISTGPEDEVICTPDIIPIDESPPSSPLLTTPPPLIPYIIQQQSVSKLKTKQILPKGRIQPVNINKLQRHLQNTLQQKIIFTPTSQLTTAAAAPAATTTVATTNNIPLLVSSSSPVNLEALNQDGLRIFVSQSMSPKLTPHTQNKILLPKKDAASINASEALENDWFNKAVIECTEVTEYISTKISNLSGVHTRAYKSERLMEELHNTLQTYVHVAIDKLRKIKRNMQVNFDKEVDQQNEKMFNPFAKSKSRNSLTEDSNTSSQDTQSASEDERYTQKEDENYSTQDDSNSTKTDSIKTKRKRKNKIVPTQHVAGNDDFILFDMDVTNASDEEMDSRATSSLASDIENQFQTEIINIISSDEDSDVEEIQANNNDGANVKTHDPEIVLNKEETSATIEANDEEILKTVNDEIKVEIKEELNETKSESLKNVIEDLVKNVESKFNISNLSSKDLLNYLSAKVIIYNNRKAQKEFAATAITETKIKDFDLVETIQNVLNTEWEQIDSIKKETDEEKPSEQVEKSEETSETFCNNDVKMEEPCDVEEMLGSSVVLRSNKSFGDEFSKFIDKTSESESQMNNSVDEDSENEVETKDISNNGDLAKNDKIIDSDLEDAELFFNKDNESLSLPPDGIGDQISKSNIFATKETESNSDLVLDSGILALKQMAENCVNPTVELRQASTECNG